MSRSVLVTGGAGFIGSHLVEALVERGDRVRVLDDLSSGRLENLEGCVGDVEVLVGDVRDAGLVERAMGGVDAVLHEAAIVSVARSFDEPELVDSVNVGGSVTVLAAARRLGVERVVLASLAAVYGNTTEVPVREDAPTAPLSPYGVGKLAVEGYARALAGAGASVAGAAVPRGTGAAGATRAVPASASAGAAVATASGPSVVCLRYFNVYGPRQDPSSEYSGVIARFLACAAAGEPYTIYGDGEQTRDFVYVGDVVQANLLALEAVLSRGSQATPASGAVDATSAGATVGAARGTTAASGRAAMAGAMPDSAVRWSINIGSGQQTSVLRLADTVECVAAGVDGGHVEDGGRLAMATGLAPRRVRHEPARSGEARDSCADLALARTALRYRPGWSLADGLRATWESLKR
jgi:UDP-glucose 4-epimerase